MKKVVVILAVSAGFLFTACTNNTPTNQNQTSNTAEQTESVASTDNDVVEVVLHSDDNMRFDKTEIRVTAGKTVRLILSHTGTMPKSAMGHNFVLLKNGTSIPDFARKAMDAPDNDYIPQSELNNIIAHTKTIGGGESDTVEFVAPEKGTYEFMCSFPGHYGTMKGEFISE